MRRGVPGAALIIDDPLLDTAVLNAAAGVVTGCAVAIAETGTIVLDHGPGQGRRAITLVPDFHLVVVTRDQVAADLPGAFVGLDPAPAAHADLWPLGHERHRTGPGRGCTWPADAAPAHR